MKSTRSRSVHVTPAGTLLLASALSLWSMSAFAQARAERFSDKEVKTLIDQVYDSRDKFEGNLDGDFKGSTVQGANAGYEFTQRIGFTHVIVGAFLQSLGSLFGMV